MKRIYLEELLSYLIVILSILFYFTVNVDHFFSWWVPDEINAINIGNKYSYFGCFKLYYIHTTINRITSDLVICTTSIFYKIGITPWLGLVFTKIVFSLTLPFSTAYLINKRFYLRPLHSIGTGFILVGIVSVVNFNPTSPLYSMDMAIYSTANSLLLIVLAMDNTNLTNRKFIFYCILFFLACCSHEVVLAICGFILIERLYFFKKIKSYLKVVSLTTLYLLASVSYFLTPGYMQRLRIWPANGTINEALLYIPGTFEYIFNILNNYSILLSVAMIFGILFSFINFINIKFSIYEILRLFIYGLSYLIVSSFLIGFSKSLYVSQSGGLPPRLSFEVYLIFSISIFILAYYFGNYLKEIYVIYIEKAKIGFEITIISILFTLTLINPDFNIFKYVFVNSIQTVIFPSKLTNEVFLGKNKILPYLGSSLYKRQISPNVPYILKYFNIDRLFFTSSVQYLKEINFHDKLNKLSVNGEEYFKINSPWLKYLLDIYKQDSNVYIAKKTNCNWFIANKNLVCDLSSTDFDINKYKVKNKKLVSLNNNHNVITKFSNGQHHIADNEIFGEHFIYTTIDINKGVYYLTFKGNPKNPKNYIYIISKNSQLLLPWIDRDPQEVYFNEFGLERDLKLLYSQSGTASNGDAFINILFSSSKDVQIILRYQHGIKTTVYNGEKSNISKLDDVFFGEVTLK
jgi:hypothetical protein